MRASATSRISSAHAAHHAAAQSNNSNKADDTSPFAQLLAAVAPKDKKSAAQGDTQDDKQADDQAVSDKGASDKNTQTTASIAAPDNKAAKDAKDTKSGDDQPVSDVAAADPAQTIAQPDPAAQQIQPQPVAQQPVPPASDDSAPVVAAAASGAAKPTAPANASAPAAPSDTDDTDDADQTDATQQAAPVQPAKVAPQVAANNKASKADDTSKTEAAKPARKAPAEAKAGDDAKPDVKADTKTDAKAAAVEAPRAPQQQQQAANTNIAPSAVTAPEALKPQAPATPVATTQHVQVAPQPTPNLPQLAVEISAKSQAGAKQFDIRLDPPELGRVEVRLSIDATGKASAHLSADQPQTLDLLRKDSTSLTQALRDAGLNVSQDGLNFSLRQQSHDGSNGQQQMMGGGRATRFTATTSNDATPVSAAYRAPTDGRLDIRV